MVGLCTAIAPGRILPSQESILTKDSPVELCDLTSSHKHISQAGDKPNLQVVTLSLLTLHKLLTLFQEASCGAISTIDKFLIILSS